MEQVSELVIDVGAACLTLPGESSCGDRHISEVFPGGVLLAAIDGLGHGDEAAFAAERACAILRAHAPDPLIQLVERCHDDLRSTRGVVMSLATFDVAHNLLTWLAVGNVAGVLRRFYPPTEVVEEPLLLRAGVVGIQLPPLQASTLPVTPGDTLIVATDGVQSGFSSELALTTSPQRVAEAILKDHSKGNDDALVVVARYRGQQI